MTANKTLEDKGFNKKIAQDKIFYKYKYTAINPSGKREQLEDRITFDLVNKKVMSNIVWTSDKELDKIIKRIKKELGWEE